jgi:hypothetical protein
MSAAAYDARQLANELRQPLTTCHRYMGATDPRRRRLFDLAIVQVTKVIARSPEFTLPDATLRNELDQDRAGAPLYTTLTYIVDGIELMLVNAYQELLEDIENVPEYGSVREAREAYERGDLTLAEYETTAEHILMEATS